MKSIKTVLLAALLVSAYESADAFQIECGGRGSGESLVLNMQSTGSSISYSNARGPAFTPIEDGPVRETSIEFYKMAFEDLKEILGSFKLMWRPETCQIDKIWWRSSCNGNAQLLSDTNSKITPTAVTLARLTESGSSGDQNWLRFRLHFEKGGNTYFVPLVFAENYCRFL